MCRLCVHEVQPDRLRTALEAGAYVLNFKGCAGCAQRAVTLKEVNRVVDLETEEDDRGEGEGEGETTESISYSHACGNCGHVVAVHEYSFVVRGSVQTYGMSCVLCGKGEHVQNMVVYARPGGGGGLLPSASEGNQPVYLANLPAEPPRLNIRLNIPTMIEFEATQSEDDEGW